MPLPGHYAGQTSQDGTISFDVSPRGWHVSNLMLTVTARRPNGGRAVIDLPVAVGRIIPVGRGGNWRARVSGEGVTVAIEANLNGSGIKGDLASRSSRSGSCRRGPSRGTRGNPCYRRVSGAGLIRNRAARSRATKESTCVGRSLEP